MNNWRRVVSLLGALQLAACSLLPSAPAPSGGDEYARRFQLPPDKAAACFARNAEEHSSALVAEVTTGGDTAQVIVRVKNGAYYGSAEFRRSGTGSTGTVTLNVRTTERGYSLIDALTEGC